MASRQQNAANGIDAAQSAVIKADRNYRDGGSLDALNNANRRLADSHAIWREVEGGNIPDDR